MGEMNRFTFRAKGKNTKKWIYGAYLKMLPYTPAPIRNEDDVIPESDYKHLIITEGFSDWNMERGLQAFDIIPETVGQCTGLKDKNGKLIYEGDILKGKKNIICSPHSSKMIDKVGVVEIPQNMFVASCRDVKNNCTLFCQFDWVKAEVIGNKYENPELIEVENGPGND